MSQIVHLDCLINIRLVPHLLLCLSEPLRILRRTYLAPQATRPPSSDLFILYLFPCAEGRSISPSLLLDTRLVFGIRSDSV